MNGSFFFHQNINDVDRIRDRSFLSITWAKYSRRSSTRRRKIFPKLPVWFGRIMSSQTSSEFCCASVVIKFRLWSTSCTRKMDSIIIVFSCRVLLIFLSLLSLLLPLSLPSPSLFFLLILLRLPFFFLVSLSLFFPFRYHLNQSLNFKTDSTSFFSDEYEEEYTKKPNFDLYYWCNVASVQLRNWRFLPPSIIVLICICFKK